jgi:lambda family phage tail tape measure protein
MANTIARLGVRLGIDSAEFSKGIEAAKKDLSEFADKAKVFATVGATAFTAMTLKALEFADSIADVAKANDMAIESVIKLGEALAQNGGNAENAGKILSAFTSFVDKAAGGSFEAQEAFKQVGVSLKDLGTLSMEQLFAQTLKGLKEIPDQLTRQARSYEILGKAAKGADIAGVAEDMEKVGHLTEQQIRGIEDAAKAWDLLHKITHEVMITFTAFVGTPMLKLAEYLESMGDLVGKVTIAWDNLGNTVNFVNRLISVATRRDVEELKRLAEDYRKIKAEIEEKQKKDFPSKPLETKTNETIKRITIEGKNPEAEKAKREAERIAREAEAERLRVQRFIISQRQQEGKEILENNRRMQEVFTTEVLRQDALEKRLKDEQDLFQLSLQQRHMRTEDVQLAKDLLEIESKRKENIQDISLNTDLNLDAQTQLIERESKLADEAERLARARNQMTKALREGSFSQGFGMAMENAFRNMSTELERGQMAFESVMGNMNAALDNFVRTGKLSFKDLARSIIQDLIAIELKAQAMSIFKSMGGMGMFSSLFAPANAGGYSTEYAQFADGGEPPVGQPSIVGERGPELFVPKSSGTIIPNNMLGSSMGGKQPSITYNGPYIANMSAIDTQSATQFLAKNKSAVWAANQTAQRSLPQSR